MSILNNEYDMLHDFFFFSFFFVHSVTAFKRGPHGRLVFAKWVLPSVNKVYYYYYFNKLVKRSTRLSVLRLYNHIR